MKTTQVATLKTTKPYKGQRAGSLDKRKTFC